MVIDPDSQRVLDLIKESGRPPFETIPAQEAKALYLRSAAALQAERPEVAETRDLSAPGPAGSVPLRLYRGRDTTPDEVLPVLIYFHGGGWVIGNLDTHDYICRHLANAARCAVVSVDYRLAPEHKFPAAVEDSEAATRWVANEANALRLDPRRIAVGGDSAGGNLSAVMALRARDGALPPLCYQLLFYPAVDQRLGQNSYRRVVSRFPLTTATVRYFQGHYLRGPADQFDWRASPLLAARHDGLPPALVVTATHDPLCDEGQEYGRKLEAAGVPVVLLHLGDQIHGYLSWSKVVRASGATLDMAAVLLRGRFAAQQG
jgi:acetyl esterase